MIAYEFNAIIKNGFIKIPGKYAESLGSKVRVIVMKDSAAPEETSTNS